VVVIDVTLYDMAQHLSTTQHLASMGDSSLGEALCAVGHGVFGSLVMKAGGRVRARALLGVSRPTFGRWMESRSGSPFYPPQLARLDAVFQRLCGEDVLVRAARMRPGSFRRFIIEHVPLDPVLVADRDPDVFLRAGVPPSTARRWFDRGIAYPSAWSSLDRLCLEGVDHRWIDVAMLWPRHAESTLVAADPAAIRGVALGMVDKEKCSG